MPCIIVLTIYNYNCDKDEVVDLESETNIMYPIASISHVNLGGNIYFRAQLCIFCSLLLNSKCTYGDKEQKHG